MAGVAPVARAAENSAISNDAFERLRTQFEKRRHAHISHLAHAMGEVDADLFTRALSTSKGSQLEFELCGALPPTTASRCNDIATTVAIGRSEKQAAQELIARSQAADRAAKQRSTTESKRDCRHDVESSGPQIASPSRFASVLSTPSEDDHMVADDTSSMQEQIIASTPIARNWETKLGDFYRHAEQHRDAALAADILAAQEAERKTQHSHVQEHNFERKHRVREAAITAESKRQKQRLQFDHYKSRLRSELLKRHADQEVERSRIIGNVHRRKQESTLHRSSADARKDFVIKYGILDRTCRKIDAQSLKTQEREEIREKTISQRNAWFARSRQLESRKVLCEAQHRARIIEDRNRTHFLLKRARDSDQQQTHERRDMILAQHAFEHFLHAAKEELVGQHHQAIQPQDVEVYERTLAAFRELAEDVRIHGMKMQAAINGQALPDLDACNEVASARMHGDGPLLGAEQRVRSAFAQEGGSAAQDHAEVASFEELFGGLSLEEDDGDANSMNALTSATAPLAGAKKQISVLPPALPATVPPPPLRVAIVPMTPVQRDNSVAPLTARPLQSLAARASGAHFSEAPHSDRATRDAQSLASLRMVRRTGPLVR